MKKIKKGDKVKIMAGKDSGKIGEVERVLSKESKILVVGINTVKRHVKSQQGVEGGVIEIIKPVDQSNAMLVCPNCQKATRVGIKEVSGKNVRFCKKCGKEI